MVQKLLKTKKIAPKKDAVKEASIVLVGTYKEKQLAWIKKNGVYNYPVKDGDELTDETWSKVKELWLYADVKSTRHAFAAEFVGKMSREEFIAAYPTYATLGEPKNKAYDVFKATPLDYGPAADGSVVVARAADFGGRSAKVKKTVKQFKADGEFAPLAAYLPSDLAKVPHRQLRVCEAAVKMNFCAKMMKTEANAPIVKQSDRPIAIDLFAGCGGLSLGFEQAGFDITAAVEIDPIHAAVHEYNFPYTKTICADIKNINGADIRRLADIGDRDVDIVFGGAPCQGFSMIGKRALDDPRNQLIGHYLRIVNDIRPKYCVLENVKGLTVGKHAQFLAELIDELKKINYKVLLPYRVLNAANYGVPQNRERLFLIAAREDQDLPAYPMQNEDRVTIQEAISDLPDADRYEQLLSDDSVPVQWQTQYGYARQLREQTPDPTNFGYNREFEQNLLTASWRTIHGSMSQTRFLAAPQGQTEPHSRFFKLAWGGQCNTLRAGTDSARGGFTSPRPIHPVLPRVITVREAARIHSYPDWFRFNKTKWHGFREIGNSVPPLLARAVGSAVIDALGIVPVKPTRVIKPGDESLLGFDMRAAADYFGVSRNVIAQRKRKHDGKQET
ncbi:MAG: DNA cytosine methyltransferase [Kiritimatiellia bacterium]